MSPRRSSRTPIVTALGVGLLAAACVNAGAPGVDIQALQADIAFGFEAPAEDAPIAPITGVPETVGGSNDAFISDGSVLVPFRNDFADRFKEILRIAAPPPTTKCPAAPIGASASKQAPEDVTDLPVEGVYRWVRDIKIVTETGGGAQLELTETGFESRLVRAVKELGAGTDVDATDPTTPQGKRFTYETVAPTIDGRTLISEWLVNTQPVSRGQNVNQDPEGITRSAEGVAESSGAPIDIPDEAQENLPGGQRIQTGEPNRGLVLLDERAVDGNGAEQGSFTPSPPLLYLPLPVQAGSFWESTSVDATSGETRRIEGRVNERRSVDACGTLIDGWLVEIDELRSSEGHTYFIEHEIVVSTEFGAVIVGERFTGDTPSGTVEADYRRGQVVPDELPEELK